MIGTKRAGPPAVEFSLNYTRHTRKGRCRFCPKECCLDQRPRPPKLASPCMATGTHDPELFDRYDRLQALQIKDIATELKGLRAELANKLVT